MKCRVIERVNCSILRWFGYMKRMPDNELLKRVYMSWVDMVNAGGRPPVKWENPALEYMRERNERRLEDAERECQDGNKWRLFR